MGEYYNYIESLIKLRGFKNMTAFCKAAGIPRSTMSEIANGRSEQPNDKTAAKIADCLGITLDEVYGRETKKAPSEDEALDGVLDAIQSREEMRALFKTVKDASPEEVKACMAFLTALRGGK